ncbi:MAG TPA: hypothetical protein VFK48_06505 [Usitatibacter sp.]|nr:hypothetical protein [Usitatibacter sp.]
MLVLRFVLLFAVLFVAGLAIAYLYTKQHRYLRIAKLTVQVALLLGVAFGLLYLFERILVML